MLLYADDIKLLVSPVHHLYENSFSQASIYMNV